MITLDVPYMFIERDYLINSERDGHGGTVAFMTSGTKVVHSANVEIKPATIIEHRQVLLTV